MSRATGYLLAACAWLALPGIAPLASAQVPDEPDDVVPAGGPAAVADAPNVGEMDRNIEQWCCSGHHAYEARSQFEGALDRDISRLNERYGLTPAQRKKLVLAGRHDVKRFFDRVDEVKAEYRRALGDWNRVSGRVSELRQMANQPHLLFGDRSMLAKTLKKTLTHEQVTRHDKAIYRARVEWLAGLLDKRLRLNPGQHRRLVTLVVDETPPLKRYGSFDYDAIMLQMARIPREKLGTALDEAQWRELTLRFDQARRMESILVSEGYVSAVERPTGATTHGPHASTRPDHKAILTGTGQGGSR
jgi:hypothetical protein